MLSRILYETSSIASINTILDKKNCSEFTSFIYSQIIPLEAVINNNLYMEIIKYLPKMSTIEKYLMVANYSLVDPRHYDKVCMIIEELPSDLKHLFYLMTKENLLINNQGKRK